MSERVESVVLCEGYEDRAFWAELLEKRLCFRDAREGRRAAIDPFGKRVEAGHFGYLSPSGHFVRIRPCAGRSEVFAALADRLALRGHQPLRRIVASVDSDAADIPSTALALRSAADALFEGARRVDPTVEQHRGGDLVLDAGAVTISLVVWSSDDDHPELPRKQTLERLVCAAIRAAYPRRAQSVAAWLGERPEPPLSRPEDMAPGGRRMAIEPKEHAHAHFAGWFADHGCDDFFRAVWRDERIASELQSRLTRSGAWRVIEALGT